MTKFLTARVIEKNRPKQRRASRDYKKSVSTSLVFRPLKFERDGYIGFKVTYSGKGSKANIDRRRLAVILIPDVNFNKSYRQIAGALARATQGEVLVCAYNKVTKHGLNEQMIQTILDRVRFEKSKIKSALFVSEDEKILDLFKQRLAEEDLHGNLREEAFVDAESGSPLSNRVEVVVKSFIQKRTVKLVKISLEKDKPGGLLAKVVGSLMKGIGRLLGSNKQVVERVELSNFLTLQKSHYLVDSRLNMRNPSHCDLIAVDILKKAVVATHN